MRACVCVCVCARACFLVSLRGRNTLSMEKIVSIDLPPVQKRIPPNWKEFALKGSKFFPFRVDPFPKGACCAGKVKENHKSCLPCKSWWINCQIYSVPLTFIPFQREKRYLTASFDKEDRDHKSAHSNTLIRSFIIGYQIYCILYNGKADQIVRKV